ncbi:hypothetical protein ACFXPA_26300 [Amycolatopsis sp. NPDC059090]|uniref:hypothetical protein n=1 Tax=unclassified Amycolatopsis TaxID=2618356 RepID=UPI00366B883C
MSHRSMNGPDHYAMADLLTQQVEGDVMGAMPHETRMERAALAQVHATLALAAATALGARMGYGLGHDAGQMWDRITNPSKRGGRS